MGFGPEHLIKIKNPSFLFLSLVASTINKLDPNSPEWKPWSIRHLQLKEAATVHPGITHNQIVQTEDLLKRPLGKQPDRLYILEQTKIFTEDQLKILGNIVDPGNLRFIPPSRRV